MGLPWFKFYPKEYLADSKVKMLSREHRSMLVDLWCYCSEDGGIPADPSDIALLLGESTQAVKKAMGKLSAFFIPEGDRLISKRLRDEALAYEEKCQKLKQSAAKGGANAQANARSRREVEGGANAQANAPGASQANAQDLLGAKSTEEEPEPEEEKDSSPTPSGPGKPKREPKVQVLGEYPPELHQAMEHYRGLMRDCKADEVLNLYPEDKRFIAKQIGANEAVWQAWKKRCASVVHGSAVTHLDMLSAIDRLIQARGFNATKGLGLNIPMLPTLINSDVFVDALVRVKEVANAS